MRNEKEPKLPLVSEPLEMPPRIAVLEVAQAESLTAKKLRESELKYRTLVETLPHAVAIIQDGKIAFANQTAAEILGFEQAEYLIGRDPLEFVAESEKDRLRDYLQRRLSGDPSIPDCYETVLHSRSGEEIRVEVRVKTFGLHGRIGSQLVVTDLTGRHQSDIQVKLFTGALEQMAEGVAVVDLRGHLLFSNRFFAVMHGYRAEEVVGRHLAILFPAEELLSLASADEETLRAGVFSGELLHCRKDGASFPVFCTSSLIRDDQGSPVGMIVTARDISEIKVAEQVTGYFQEKTSQCVSDLENQLRETAEQLEDSQSEQKNYTTLLEQANKALKVVINEIENQNRERERAVYRNLSTNVLPIVDQLKSERLPDSVRLLLNSLEFNLKSLFSPPPRAFSQKETLLTPQETRLCELIRSGLTSKQMANVMGISPATVVVHRANIRKKLGLVGSDDNLATYLRSKL